MEFIVAIKDSPKGPLLIITDKDLIGKKFEEDNLQLDLTSSFYQGEVMGKEKILELMKGAYIIHATGKGSIELLKDINLIDGNSGIISVDNVLHAEVYLGD